MNNYYASIPSPEMSDMQEVMKKFCDQIEAEEAHIIELGVSEGRNLIFLASYMRFLGKKARIWGVDTLDYGSDHQRNTLNKNIINSGEKIEFLEMSSLDASCKFDNDYFDLVFVDSSHLHNQTISEGILWYRKLREKGIIAFHDYLTIPDVKLAVDTLVPANRLTVEETEFGNGVAWTRFNKDIKLI